MSEKKKGLILASVFNKKGIAKFAKNISRLGYQIISTEGTGKELTKKAIPFIPAQKISKNPNGLKDCIQTISFNIEAGILFNRSNSAHIKKVKELGLVPIDIVICNFPPLEKVIKNPAADFNISNVDVGGPLMVRAAATNFKDVLVIVDPDDYIKVAQAILENKVTTKLRNHLATKAFAYTCAYDQKIVRFLKKNKFDLPM